MWGLQVIFLIFIAPILEAMEDKIRAATKFDIELPSSISQTREGGELEEKARERTQSGSNG